MFRIRVIAAVMLIGFVPLIGCSTKPTAPTNPEPEIVNIEVPDEDVKELARGNNEFAFDLYKKLAETEKGNIIVSPYSIRTALAMTYAGARGQTADEMKKVLHFTLPDERLHATVGSVTDSFQTAGKKRLLVARSTSVSRIRHRTKSRSC
jgi:serpin B